MVLNHSRGNGTAAYPSFRTINILFCRPETGIPATTPRHAFDSSQLPVFIIPAAVKGEPSKLINNLVFKGSRNSRSGKVLSGRVVDRNGIQK